MTAPAPDGLLARLLSDRFRLPLAALLGLALAAVGYSWAERVRTVPEGYHACMVQPEHCEGKQIVLSLVEVTEILDPQRYVVVRGIYEVPVKGDAASRYLGEQLTVIGIFDPARELVVATLEKPPQHRQGKWYLGGVGLAFFALMLPVWFTVRGGRVVERA